MPVLVAVLARWRATPHRRRALLALAAPTAVAVGLVSWNLGNPSMTGVEAVSYWAAKLPFPALVRLLHHVDVVHGTYYAGLHVLFGILGASTLVMRLPSAVGAVAAVLLVGVLARRVTGSDRVALLAASTLTLCPVFVSYGQFGRSYAVDSALVVALTLLLVRIARGPVRARTWWAYTALATVLVYLHEFTVLAIAAHAVTLAWARVPRRLLLRFTAQAGVAVVLALPVILTSTGQDAQVGYLGRPTFHTLVELGLSLFGPGHVGAAIGLALTLVGIVGLRTRGPGLTLVRLALPLLALPSVVLVVESELGRPLFSGVRYVLYSTAGLALLVAGGVDLVIRALLARRARPGRVLGTLAVVCALALLAVPQVAPLAREHTLAGHGQDLLGAARVLQRHGLRGDAVAYSPRDLVLLDLVYPGAERRLTDVQETESSARSGTLYGLVRRGRPYRDALLEHGRVWVVTRPGLGLIGVERFLRRHGYVEHRPFRVVGVRLILFQRNRGRSVAGPLARVRRS